MAAIGWGYCPLAPNLYHISWLGTSMYRYASVHRLLRSAHPRFSGAARPRGRVRRDVRRLYARNNPRPRPRAPGARAARKYYRMCSRGSCPSRGRASPYRAPGSPRRTRSWSRGVTDASRTTRSAGRGCLGTRPGGLRRAAQRGPETPLGRRRRRRPTPRAASGTRARLEPSRRGDHNMRGSR